MVAAAEGSGQDVQYSINLTKKLSSFNYTWLETQPDPTYPGSEMSAQTMSSSVSVQIDILYSSTRMNGNGSQQ